MKFSKKIIFFLILLAFCIYTNIGQTPYLFYRNKIVVNKTAQEAWAVLTDDSKFAEWNEGYKRSELIKGKANTSGAIYKLYIQEDGQERIIQKTITSIKKNEDLEVKYLMDIGNTKFVKMELEYDIELEEKDGETVIDILVVTWGKGWLSKAFLEFKEKKLNAIEDKKRNSLKKLIDENTTEYFSVKPTKDIE